MDRIVTVAPENLSIRLDNPGPTEKTAVSQLQDLLRTFAGSGASDARFEIIIGCLDGKGRVGGIPVKNARRLESLANSDQAYLIQPLGDDRLVVAALAPRGVYYGVMTLVQLIESRPGRNGVAIPVATVTDWPDFADRGFWHMRAGAIPRLSRLKLNYIESFPRLEASEERKIRIASTSSISGREREKGTWSLDSACAESRKYAVKFVHGITHLDLWAESPELLEGKGDRERLERGYQNTAVGFTKAFPELVGKGDRARRFDRYQGLCFSQPGLVDLLADLMWQVALLGGDETTAWMSEYPGIQCECPRCLEAGQLQLEVKATLKAWQRVREQYPGFRLKVFYGRGGYPMRGEAVASYPEAAMREIIALLPGEVALCASGGTGGFLPMHAEQGGLTGQWAAGPALSYWDFFNCGARETIARALDRKYYALCQFTPGCGYYFNDDMREIGLQVSVIAEYTWNTHGRDLGEFLGAWATRNGVSDPQRFSEFARTIPSAGGAGAPISTFVEGGSWLPRIPKAITSGERGVVPPDFRPERNEAMIRACEQALEIARDLAPKEFADGARASLCYHRLEAKAHAFVNAAIDGIAEEAAFQSFDKAVQEFIEACALRVAPSEASSPVFFRWQTERIAQVRKDHDAIRQWYLERGRG
ncbi:MAG: hypothetical protein HY321_02615 [Armatimonadetes bacterium]|nr:hypothetical protein [Armatimonadota bacterium]